jgi:hypothetical protein
VRVWAPLRGRARWGALNQDSNDLSSSGYSWPGIRRDLDKRFGVAYPCLDDQSELVALNSRVFESTEVGERRVKHVLEIKTEIQM